ncbi:hypothetical protein TNCV_2282631 [Trichonephila clavipes]|nr:hypothetical protein TNCV_2282631 [Trichonephila clavipes]
MSVAKENGETQQANINDENMQDYDHKQPSEKDIVQPEDISNAPTEKCLENHMAVRAGSDVVQYGLHRFRRRIPPAHKAHQTNLGGRTGKILRPSSVALKSKNQEINRLQLAVKMPWAIFFESVDILS